MLVNITTIFDFSGKRYFIGDNPDVDPSVAAIWIANGWAARDYDGVQNGGPGAGGGIPNQTGTLAASATAAPVADTVIAALATKATAGVLGSYATLITATGSLTALHFGGTLVAVSSASAVQLNVPLDSALALSALAAGSFHAAMFDVTGAGAVTFAGATGVTINGIAGPTAVALSFAQYSQALLKQTAANTWTVS